MKTLDSGHLQVLKSVSIIKRCSLLGGSLTKIVTFGTKHFCPLLKVCLLLGGFTVSKLKKKITYAQFLTLLQLLSPHQEEKN